MEKKRRPKAIVKVERIGNVTLNDGSMLFLAWRGTPDSLDMVLSYNGDDLLIPLEAWEDLMTSAMLVREELRLKIAEAMLRSGAGEEEIERKMGVCLRKRYDPMFG